MPAINTLLCHSLIMQRTLASAPELSMEWPTNSKTDQMNVKTQWFQWDTTQEISEKLSMNLSN